MAITAHKGRRFEHDVIHYLRSLGFTCTRSAGSKGVIDIVAMKKDQTRLIQCKNGDKSVPLSEVKALKAFAVEQCRPVEIWHKKSNGTITITNIDPSGGLPMVSQISTKDIKVATSKSE